MEIEEIKKIVQFFEKSNLSRLKIKKDGFEIELEKKIIDEKLGTEEKVVTKIKQSAEKSKENQNESFITSPMVGTFYTSPSPELTPFIKVGDEVKENSIVCIIEAMKVMNEVKAGINGVIKEVLCKNFQPIEFGTRLFKIEKK